LTSEQAMKRFVVACFAFAVSAATPAANSIHTQFQSNTNP
jgi:hypothetical protein